MLRRRWRRCPCRCQRCDASLPASLSSGALPSFPRIFIGTQTPWDPDPAVHSSPLRRFVRLSAQLAHSSQLTVPFTVYRSFAHSSQLTVTSRLRSAVSSRIRFGRRHLRLFLLLFPSMTKKWQKAHQAESKTSGKWREAKKKKCKSRSRRRRSGIRRINQRILAV